MQAARRQQFIPHLERTRTELDDGASQGQPVPGAGAYVEQPGAVTELATSAIGTGTEVRRSNGEERAKENIEVMIDAESIGSCFSHPIRGGWCILSFACLQQNGSLQGGADQTETPIQELIDAFKKMPCYHNQVWHRTRSDT